MGIKYHILIAQRDKIRNLCVKSATSTLDHCTNRYVYNTQAKRPFKVHLKDPDKLEYSCGRLYSFQFVQAMSVLMTVSLPVSRN